MEISSASAFTSGLSSIQSGQRRVDQAAVEVAGSSLPSGAASASATAPDLASLLLELEMGKLEVEAGAKVLQAVDETLGTLIDTTA
jgi:hypothetical protein